MHRKIKTWAYAILLLNIVVAGIGIAKLLFDVLPATEIHKTDYFSRTCI